MLRGSAMKDSVPPNDFFRANDLTRTVERYMTPEEARESMTHFC